MITHELGHLVFRVGDNNNNPHVTPYRRVGTGPWDMMGRGPGPPGRVTVTVASESDPSKRAITVTAVR